MPKIIKQPKDEHSTGFINSEELMEQIRMKEQADAKMENGFLGEDIYGDRIELEDPHDAIHNPKHYELCGIETKYMIKVILNHFGSQLTPWQSFCLGNALKYRFRSGKKDPYKLEEDINKSMEFEQMFHL